MKSGIAFVMTAALLILGVSLLADCGGKAAGKKVLYYQNPMNPAIHSEKPAKDQMGMDYIPVYAEESATSQGKTSSNGVWYYTCSMHPQVKQHEPGNCPICKMELVPVLYPEKENAAVEYYECPMHPEVKADQPGKCPKCGMELAPKYRTDKEAFTSVKLTPDDEAKIHVTTSVAEYRAISRTIRTFGKIDYSERGLSTVSARVPGRIDKLFVNATGTRVKKEQPLLLLYSPELITAEQELLQAWRDVNGTSGAATLSDLSKQLFDSARRKLLLLGLSEEQVAGVLSNNEPMVHLPVISPAEGIVTKMNVISGMYVEEGMAMYELADLSTVWLKSEVYEQDIGSVAVGQKVIVKSGSYPDRTFEGRITFIEPTLDPMTRTARVRAELDNPGELLKPEMYVNADVLLPGQGDSLVIPATAVLDTGMRKIVYIAQGGGTYVGRVVILGPRSGDWYPVVSGVNPGERVVTYGNYLIDSQSQLSGNGSIQYSGAN
jgi:Cu(I)/Ag(I) efflux system membrane fusion protein